MFDLVWDMWDHRNTIRHDPQHPWNVEERRQLQREVRQQFQQGWQDLPRFDRDLFCDEEHTLGSPTKDITKWLLSVELARQAVAQHHYDALTNLRGTAMRFRQFFRPGPRVNPPPPMDIPPIERPQIMQHRPPEDAQYLLNLDEQENAGNRRKRQICDPLPIAIAAEVIQHLARIPILVEENNNTTVEALFPLLPDEAPPPNSLSLHSFQTLQPREWLNDEIVNGMMHLIRERLPPGENNTLLFPTHLMQFLTGGAHLDYDYEAVRNYGRRQCSGGKRVLDYERIIIPINLPGAHWLFAVVYTGRKEIRVFDSLRNQALADKYGEAILKYLGDEHRLRGGPDAPPDAHTWNQVMDESFPEQPNGYDCGIFAIFGMDCVALNIPFLMSAVEVALVGRQYVASRLLRATRTPSQNRQRIPLEG